ncbi:hypothetical protein Q0N88_19350 [Bacillus thuringiensis]|uniref:hypothetical protein n=1 Tax=Bacillus thuringiensis TaxID=1428 RepID=UPI00345ABD32
MYIFDVNYTVNGEAYLKSYLLAQPEDGFLLTNFPKELSFLKRVQDDSPTVGGR